MRALKYRLKNGEIVSTMAEAKASGMKYTEVLETIKEPLNITKKRSRLLGQFGVIR